MPPLSRKKFFNDMLNAHLKCYQSWDGKDEQGRLFFQVWAAGVSEGRAKVFTPEDKQDLKGRRSIHKYDRMKNINNVKNGVPAFAFIVEWTTPEERKTKKGEFDKVMSMFKIEKIVRDDAGYECAILGEELLLPGAVK